MARREQWFALVVSLLKLGLSLHSRTLGSRLGSALRSAGATLSVPAASRLWPASQRRPSVFVPRFDLFSSWCSASDGAPKGIDPVPTSSFPGRGDWASVPQGGSTVGASCSQDVSTKRVALESFSCPAGLKMDWDGECHWRDFPPSPLSISPSSSRRLEVAFAKGSKRCFDREAAARFVDSSARTLGLAPPFSVRGNFHPPPGVHHPPSKGRQSPRSKSHTQLAVSPLTAPSTSVVPVGRDSRGLSTRYMVPSSRRLHRCTDI